MPSMFSRRRGSASKNVPIDPVTSASATLAASQAFLHNTASTTSLSSAAAAAALRSHTTSPEPVGSIQTKRMMRRGSTSSIGSGSVAGSVVRGPSGRAPLQRRDSGGSMTERTFRTPSPSHANGAISSPHAIRSDVPPVPSIPANVARAHHQRTSSLEGQSPRVTSPTPSRGRRGGSADRANMSSPPPTSSRAPRLSDVMESPESAKSPSSRNFSRPMSPQPDSPTSPSSPTGAANKYTHTTGAWHTGAAGQRATPGEPPSAGSAQSKVDRILAASNVNPARNIRVSSAQGHHLAQASNVPARSHSSATFRSTESTMVYDPNSRTFVQRPKDPVQNTQPPSPRFTSAKPDPGIWDPNTRKFIPRPSRSATTSPVPSSTLVRPPKTRPALAAVDTTLVPPPKNPARYSPTTASPSSPRFETLNRQPSVVLEDREGEAKAESSTKKTTVSVTPVAKAAAPAQPTTENATASKFPDRTVSLNIPRTLDNSARGRNSSVSPQRSAHFSASPVLEPTRHEPPGRDISPFKSALKQPSPASSVRATSPMASKSAPSEISDTVSDVGSQDGLTASGKKKKSVRVSFDEHAQAITPVAVRPITPPTEDEEDSFMKPRPALPSFGSVRKNRMQPEPAEKVTEMAPERHEASSDHAIGGILKNRSPSQDLKEQPLPPLVTSKESAEHASDTESEGDTSAARVPKPPKSDANAEIPSTTAKDFAPPATTTEPSGEGSELPAITLLPPTPGLDESAKKELGDEPAASAEPVRNVQRSSMEGIIVPGGWGADEATGSSIAAPVGLGVSQPIAAPAVGVAQPGHSKPDLSDIDETETTDDDAEFSDAAEDLSDLEDGGFASLDAMVESPLVTPVKPAQSQVVAEESPGELTPRSRSPVDAPATAAPSTEAQPGEGVEGAASDWGQATNYWSKLTQQQRLQMELQHLNSDDETTPVSAAKKSTKKSAVAPINVAVATSTPDAKAQPLKPALKKSMRAQPGPSPTSGEQTQLRQSMRTTGTMPKTMRGAGGPPMATQSQAAQLNTVASTGRVQDKTQTRASQQYRPTSPQPAPQATGRLTKQQPTAANDSDSESSFRKRRRAGSNSTVDSQGRYSMKRSMRGGAAEPVPSQADRRPSSPSSPRGKGSLLRSLSPSGSLFGRKSKPSPQAPPPDSGRLTSLRGSSGPRGSTSKSLRSSAAPASGRSKFKSRFVDSDDDDDDAPRGGFFRSRFADSDDEEPSVPAVSRTALAPVRGIPRRQGQYDGDSTDLDDSDDDRKSSRGRGKQSKAGAIDPVEVEKAMAAARRNLGLEHHEGTALSQGTLRTEPPPPAAPAAETRPPLNASPDTKRRSFMGSILRRNRGSTSSIPQMGSPARPQSPPPAMPPLVPSTPVRAKLVRKGSSQVRANAGSSVPASETNSPVATRKDTEDWPLPPPIPNDEPAFAGYDRPQTSDGVSNEAVLKLAQTMRPSMQPRSMSNQATPTTPRVRIQAGEEGSEPGERERDRVAFAQRGAKKKKFGMLRRAFKLDG